MIDHTLKTFLPRGRQRVFLAAVENAASLSTAELANSVNICERTWRDWRREKWRMSDEAMHLLSRRFQVPIPSGARRLPRYWSIPKAASLGGRRRFALYGPPGTLESRRKGWRILQERIRKDPTYYRRLGMTFQKTISIPQKSTKTAEFIGILLGDGGISKYQVAVSFNSQTDRPYARWIQRLGYRLFGLSSKISYRKDAHAGTVIWSSVKLVQWLARQDIPAGHKIRHGTRVPMWIWTKHTYKRACLRGLMDTDGCFYRHQYRSNGDWYVYPKLAFTAYSPQLRQDGDRLFRELGFHPRVRGMRVWIDNAEEARRYLRIIGTRRRLAPALLTSFRRGDRGA